MHTDIPRATNLLVVDDDTAFRATIVEALAPLADTIVQGGSVADALVGARDGNPELIVLDLGLPDGDGLDAVRGIRRFSNVPIVVLTGRGGEEDKVALLDAGADDFVTKPFSAAELSARVRAHLRRARTPERSSDERRIVAGPVTIDLLRRIVTRSGEEVRLTPTEWALLRTLVQHAGRTMTHHEIWGQVWEREFGDPQLHLRVHVTHLRRKIEPVPSVPCLLVTEPGVGYRFVLPE